MNEERLLRLFLRAVGVCGILALSGVLMPHSWMAAIHSRMGMGELPSEPIVGYLARSASGLYALHGVLLLVMSFDVRRYRTALCYFGGAGLLYGLALLVTDLVEGMPLSWTLGEAIGNAVLATTILTLAYRLGPSAEPTASGASPASRAASGVQAGTATE